MEVLKEEYKDTKIGRIPKDWELLPVGKCILKKKFSVGKLSKKDYFKTGSFPIIDQSKTFIIGYTNQSELLYSGNLPAIIYGDHTNHVKYVDFPFVCGADGVKIIQPLTELDNKFIYYSIFYRKPQSEGYKRHFSILKEKDLCIPPVSEQQKIAEILSTVDKQISTTQDIIDKSKELKKGLMQKLFSEGIGHTEFKDTKIGRIPKDWDVAMIKDVCKVVTSGFSFDVFEKSKLDIGTEVLFTKVSDMNLKGNERIIKDSVNKGFFADDFVESNSVLKPNSLIFPKRGAAIKTNKKRINGKHIILDPNLIAVSFGENCRANYLFIYYYFISFDLMRIVEDGTIPQLNKRDIEPFKIPLPPIPEQQKIAEILSEADSKIEKEEQEKVKLEELKKGLMQQLLTGKKRVKV